MKVVAFVPIKLNSDRVPKKNIRKLGKKALCYYLINTLLEIKEIDDVYVYCSDEKVLEYIPKGAIFLKRSEELDRDDVKGEQIYSSFIKEVNADIYVLAHTTSPFTKKESVINALIRVLNNENDSAFSAQRIQTFSWFRNKPINYSLDNIPRTQDIEPILVETSSFYIFKREIWRDYKRRIGFTPYIQEVDSIEAVEIDTIDQWELAKSIAKNMGI